MAVARHALTLRLKGQHQGHTVVKCAAGVGMQVDMTVWVSSFVIATTSVISSASYNLEHGLCTFTAALS